jgi:hypothetical protein
MLKPKQNESSPKIHKIIDCNWGNRHFRGQMKSYLLPIGALAMALFAQSASAEITVESLLLHSRADSTTTPTSYFKPNGAVSATSAASSVGGNSVANGGPGGSLYTSGNYNVVGVRSGAWVLDTATLGITMNGLYDLDITWGNQSSLKLVRIEVTDAIGKTVFNNVSQTNGINAWMSLGSFTFDGGAGQEVRIFNNESTSAGNVQFDSIRLTQVPEPSTIALGLVGGVGLLVLRRRKSN